VRQLHQQNPGWPKKVLAFEAWQRLTAELSENELPSVATIQRGMAEILIGGSGSLVDIILSRYPSARLSATLAFRCQPHSFVGLLIQPEICKQTLSPVRLQRQGSTAIGDSLSRPMSFCEMILVFPFASAASLTPRTQQAGDERCHGSYFALLRYAPQRLNFWSFAQGAALDGALIEQSVRVARLRT
jgi:hypothetical protein